MTPEELIARELRAQAEAMPRIVREGRDFDVVFHDNGAAQRDEATGTGQRTEPQCPSPSGIRQAALQDDPAAAPPSATQPVAWMYQHEETGNVNFRPHNERWADHRRYVEIPLYTAPPDLAARVRELEGLLRRAMAQRSKLAQSDHKLDDDINAALAKGE